MSERTGSLSWEEGGHSREEGTLPSTFALAVKMFSMFVLAHGGMNVPVSFLADHSNTESDGAASWRGGSPKDPRGGNFSVQFLL